MRTGIANLPLHSGKCPRWLFEKMVELGRVLVELLVIESGPEEVLLRLSDPFWFQALGCVLGFDWHSSGLTTTVCGALKEAVRGRERDLGLFVCGGKGATALKTPEEILRLGDRHALAVNPEALVRASRLTAKVDQAALQDGYDLYHHTFAFSVHGAWTVIQQGMNPDAHRARRYHWSSRACRDFVVEPHTAVCCDAKGLTLNLVARESDAARKNLPALAQENPDRLVADLKQIQERVLDLPGRHRLLLTDLNPARLRTVFEKSYLNPRPTFSGCSRPPAWAPGASGHSASSPNWFTALRQATGTRPGSPSPTAARTAPPFPVDRSTFEHSIRVLRRVVEQSRLGLSDKRAALGRLARFAEL